jgi:hypothetical protein
MPDGKVIVEPLLRTARGNGLSSLEEAVSLVAAWERRGYVKRRADGGYDVLNNRPRPDTQTVKSMRFAASLDER